jgi:hypothetical protein
MSEEAPVRVVEKHKQYERDQQLASAIARLGDAEGRAYVAQAPIDAQLDALEYALLTDEQFDAVIAAGRTPTVDF